MGLLEEVGFHFLAEDLIANQEDAYDQQPRIYVHTFLGNCANNVETNLGMLSNICKARIGKYSELLLPIANEIVIDVFPSSLNGIERFFLPLKKGI